MTPMETDPTCRDVNAPTPAVAANQNGTYSVGVVEYKKLLLGNEGR